MNSVMRFLDRHPWMALAAGVGISTVSILRIRRDRKAKRQAKLEHRLEKRTAKVQKKAQRDGTKVKEKARELGPTR